ncbi:hypothetical protein [Caulobacter sp. NIBR2454]|uniref:hypothetical protein n=1 Tax=Caulobacter sp. NIBR2454 TaxID=3015996 RepID=UPI0022B7114F|nr:hypothetical protein [Caulobacter sp. NIBR2454]
MTIRNVAHSGALRAALVVCVMTAPSLAQAQTAITPEQVQQAIVVMDDPLEQETAFSTERAVRSTRGVFRTLHNDGYLRAAVHKGTGQVRFEVRQTFNYIGTFRHYERVNYETDALPRSARLLVLAANKAHCQAIEFSQACLEQVSFEVSEADLRRAAESTGGHDPQAWELKFKPQLGEEHRTQLPKAEIVGLLRTVDAYRASQNFSTASASKGMQTTNPLQP